MGWMVVGAVRARSRGAVNFLIITLLLHGSVPDADAATDEIVPRGAAADAQGQGAAGSLPLSRAGGVWRRPISDAQRSTEMAPR